MIIQQMIFLYIYHIYIYTDTMGCSISTPSIVNDNNTTTPIKHVILLILENRSFDQVFGYRNDYPIPFKVDGVQAAEDVDQTKRNYNLDVLGNKIYQNPIEAFTGDDDSTHDLAATLYSMNRSNAEQKNMGGFIIANQNRIKDELNNSITTPIKPEEIMGYFPKNSFPIYEYIADNFIICDKWFASAPCMTLPNRAFGLTGTSAGHIDNSIKGLHPHLIYPQDTIFDRLNEKHVSWKSYIHDTPLSLIHKNQWKPKNITSYHHFSQFEKDIQNHSLPAFSYIEPEYGVESSDKHIADINNGQTLVYNIITSLQSNKEIWESCLFVIYYDENGGMYDHVYPPKIIPPEDKPISIGNFSYKFDRLGFRVPAMLVSPRIPRGVDSTQYDHTSVLKFIADNWGLKYLTNRDAYANDPKNLISKIRTDYPMLIDNNTDNKLFKNYKHDTTYRNRVKDANAFDHIKKIFNFRQKKIKNKINITI